MDLNTKNLLFELVGENLLHAKDAPSLNKPLMKVIILKEFLIRIVVARIFCSPGKGLRYGKLHF